MSAVAQWKQTIIMTARNTLSSRISSNIPDLDSGGFGLESSGMYETAASEQPSVIMVKRERPQIPPKKTHLDEVLCLQKQLKDMRDEKERAEEETDMMAQDLCVAQDEAQEKDDELQRKETKLQDYEVQLKTWREKAQSLSVEVQEAKELAVKFETKYNMQETCVTSNRENELQKEEEIVQLRNQVEDLTEKESEKQAAAAHAEREFVTLRSQIIQLKATLEEKATELKSKDTAVATVDAEKLQAALQEKQLQSETKLKEIEDRLTSELKQQQELRRAAEAELQVVMGKLTIESNEKLEQSRAVEAELRRTKEQFEANISEGEGFQRTAAAMLQSTKDQYEAKLRASAKHAAIEIEALKQRAQTAEASLHEQSKRKEVDGAQDQLVGSLLAENDEQQRLAKYFASQNERLSREIKEMRAARRAMEQAEFEIKRQLDDYKAQVRLLQQVKEGDMPELY